MHSLKLGCEKRGHAGRGMAGGGRSVSRVTVCAPTYLGARRGAGAAALRVCAAAVGPAITRFPSQTASARVPLAVNKMLY